MLKSLHNCKPNTGAFEGMLWDKEIARSDLSAQAGGCFGASENFVSGCGANSGKSGSFSTQKNAKKYFLFVETCCRQGN